MKNSELMAARRRFFPTGSRPQLLHWLGWALLAAALFYAIDRYFQYRERRLDERLEQLRQTSPNPATMSISIKLVLK